MKTRGINKKILIVVLTLLSVVVFSAFSIVLIHLVRKDKSGIFYKDVSSVVTKLDVQYSFGGYGNYIGSNLPSACTKDQYNSYTVFGVDGPYGLLAFSHSVANGYSFSGKTVYLLGDVDGSYIDRIKDDDGNIVGNYVPIGADMWNKALTTKKYNGSKVFEGTFNGQGFTISSLKCSIDSRNSGGIFSSGSGPLHMGLFAKCSETAVIKNLKVKNFQMSNYSNETDSYIGGICGIWNDGGTLANCCVESLGVLCYDESTYIGGLVGYRTSYTTVGIGIGDTAETLLITDCMVNGINISQAKTPASKHSIYPAFGYHSVTSGYSTSTLDGLYYLTCQNCVVVSGVTNSTIPSDDNNSFSATNIRTSKSPDGLEWNSVGGNYTEEVGDDYTVWFWASDYNNGWPQLRVFIKDWDPVSFGCGSGLSLNKYSIYVPSDYTSVCDSSSESLTVCGQTITATLDNSCCYSFSSDIWTNSGSRAYYANSTRNVGTITFKYDSNIVLQTVWQDGSWSGDHASQLSHYFYCGETMGVSFTSLRSGVYSRVTLSFNGISVVYSMKSSSAYYISGLKVNGAWVASNIYIHGAPTVEIVLSLKQYTPSFQ